MKLCFILSGCEVLIYMIISVKIKEKMTKFSCVFRDCSVLIYLSTFVRSSKTESNICTSTPKNDLLSIFFL
ncbi:hypothetical protein Hanom_Chr11g00992421 [Helianthus anomalus]